MTQEESFMHLALDQARIALARQWIPVGAVFVRDSRVITHARKMGIGSPLRDHAERRGCDQILWDGSGMKNLEGFDVYVTLEPCLMCITELMGLRVSRIFYAFGDPYGGGAYLLTSSQELPPRFQKRRPMIKSGVLAAESQALLREFFSRQTGPGTWTDPENALRKLAMS